MCLSTTRGRGRVPNLHYCRVPHVAHARLCANERARHVANGNAAKSKTQETKRATSQKSKTHSTGPSHVVPHHSTTPARALTSLFGWEAVILACMAVCVRRRSQIIYIATALTLFAMMELMTLSPSLSLSSLCTAREKQERAQHQTHSTCTSSSSIRPRRAVGPTAAELWPTHTA